jgi:short-subunit dehydrogenase
MKNIALVTGATSGLGLAFLQEWQARGLEVDQVWLVARHQEALQALAEGLPWPARLFALDLSVASDREALAEALDRDRPRVRFLVCSAGWGKAGRARDLARAEAVNMVALNDEALTDVTLMALPYCGRGSVLFEIASVAAFLPQPNFAVYAATKAYVQSFARALNAEEACRGIRVVSVCPNPMLTGFFDRAGVRIDPIKRFFAEDPRQVARRALDTAERGRDVSLNCLTARFIRLAAKVLPHRSILKAEALILFGCGGNHGKHQGF